MVGLGPRPNKHAPVRCSESTAARVRGWAAERSSESEDSEGSDDKDDSDGSDDSEDSEDSDN